MRQTLLVRGHVGAGAAAPVTPSIDSTGPQEQKRFKSPYAMGSLVDTGFHALRAGQRRLAIINPGNARPELFLL